MGSNDRRADTWLKAMSGELVCLRRVAKEKEKEKESPERAKYPSQAALSALLESVEFPAFDLTVQLVKVTPGSELGAMERLRDESDVIAVSLNYIGEAAALTLVQPPPRRNEWRMMSDEQAPSPARAPPMSNYPRVLVVDVEPSHCQKVMRAVAQGACSVANATPIEIIGRSLGADNATLATLHEYVTLLLQTASSGGSILALNMSVAGVLPAITASRSQTRSRR